VLRSGEQLVVEVAGHHWPAHARNPHTGEDPAAATALRADRRTVLAGALRLPWFPAGTATVPAHRVPEVMAT
jgi:predicted acyl esterase